MSKANLVNPMVILKDLKREKWNLLKLMIEGFEQQYGRGWQAYIVEKTGLPQSSVQRCLRDKTEPKYQAGCEIHRVISEYFLDNAGSEMRTREHSGPES